MEAPIRILPGLDEMRFSLDQQGNIEIFQPQFDGEASVITLAAQDIPIVIRYLTELAAQVSERGSKS